MRNIVQQRSAGAPIDPSSSRRAGDATAHGPCLGRSTLRRLARIEQQWVAVASNTENRDDC
jgi:hypothetical protein